MHVTLSCTVSLWNLFLWSFISFCLTKLPKCGHDICHCQPYTSSFSAECFLSWRYFYTTTVSIRLIRSYKQKQYFSLLIEVYTVAYRSTFSSCNLKYLEAIVFYVTLWLSDITEVEFVLPTPLNEVASLRRLQNKPNSSPLHRHAWQLVRGARACMLFAEHYGQTSPLWSTLGHPRTANSQNACFFFRGAHAHWWSVNQVHMIISTRLLFTFLIAMEAVKMHLVFPHDHS